MPAAINTSEFSVVSPVVLTLRMLLWPRLWLVWKLWRIIWGPSRQAPSAGFSVPSRNSHREFGNMKYCSQQRFSLHTGAVVLLVWRLPCCGCPAALVWHAVSFLVQSETLKRLIYKVIFIKLTNVSEKNMLNKFPANSWHVLLKFSLCVYFQMKCWYRSAVSLDEEGRTLALLPPDHQQPHNKVVLFPDVSLNVTGLCRS